MARRERLKALSRATGIPYPTLDRAERGEVKLSPLSRSRLRNFARRERYAISRKAGLTAREANLVKGYSHSRLSQYLKLRKSGSMIHEAREYSTLDKKAVSEISHQLLTYAKEIAKGNHVPLRHVIKGMMKSDRTVDDWEVYVTTRNLDSWIPVERKGAGYVVVSKDSKKFKNWLSRQKDEGRGA